MKISALKPSQFVTGALIAFVAFLIPCFAVDPQLLRQNRGISDYVRNPSTVVPYTLGMVASIILLAYAARTLNSTTAPQVRAKQFLAAVAALELALLIVPSTLNKTIRYVHVGFGMTLFLVEYATAVWMVVQLGRSRGAMFFVAILAIAGILSFLSLTHNVGILPQSEVVFQLAFLALCIQGLRRVE